MDEGLPSCTCMDGAHDGLVVGLLVGKRTGS